MSDDVEPEAGHEPSGSWWPQTVRVRLTIVATLAFAITISAAAFGLVRLVHSNLVDRIEETNQQQLDYLQAQIERGELDPDSHREHLLRRRRAACRCAASGTRTRVTTRKPSAQVDSTAGRITLVAQQSTAAVNRTVDSVTNVLLFAVPRHDRPRRARSVVLRRTRAQAGRGDPPGGGVDHRRHHRPSRARARHRRRGRPPRPHHERHARPARGLVAEAAAVRLRRVARAAQPAGVHPHQPRGRAAQPRPHRLAGGRRARAGRGRAHGGHRERAARARPARRDRRRRSRSTSLPEVDLDELVLDDTVQQRRVPVDTAACRPAGCTAAASSCPAWSREPARQRGASRVDDRSRSSWSPTTGRSSSPSTTTAPASPSRTASACSSASPASTTAGPATPAGSGSGSRW